MFGDFAPTLVAFTDDVLFGQVWKRPELSAKERSLVTVASLTTSGNTEQLAYHLGLAKRNGASEQELIEAITPAWMRRWRACSCSTARPNSWERFQLPTTPVPFLVAPERAVLVSVHSTD